MAQYNFGLGSVTFVPPGTNPTPVPLCVLKDVSFDISMTVKELRGASQFPVDIARAEAKISGKAKFAQVIADVVASILATTATTGTKIGVKDEASSGAIPTTPFQLTCTNSATWAEDLGVYNITLGRWMTRVASGPTTGQYSVAAGVYTFALADVGGFVLFNYVYTAAASGKTVSLTNGLMGSGTTYMMHAYNTFKTKNIGVKFYAVTIPKLAFAMKQTDYMDMDVDFDAFEDSSHKVLDFYSSE